MQQIKNLDDLMSANINKKAVVIPTSRAWTRRMPAAFMIHQPGERLWHLFREGMFIYQKKEKKDVK